MLKLFENTKGAVTVMVTFLLIPAMLVSGTSVDLARIYTAQSVIQDANQLAANTVLTQYEAMLQDIYGLFGVMENDEIFDSLLSEYIESAILGEGWQDRGLGTFQLFYGAGLQSTVVPETATQKNLRNPEVIRRQIEEYAKFRVPVIIVQEIMERLDRITKLKDDADAIKQKMKIDDKIDEIDKLYEEIYNLINEINGKPEKGIKGYPQAEEAAFASINAFLAEINAQMRDLKSTRDQWISNYDSSSVDRYDLMSDMEYKYSSIKQNIRSLVNGGTVVSGWIDDEFDEEGEWISGWWSGSTRSSGLNKAIGDHRDELNKYIDKMDKLIEICEKADGKKAELKQMIDDLEDKLNSGDCSGELVKGMTEPYDAGGEVRPSVIEEYRTLLEYELKPMADVFKEKNKPYIDSVAGDSGILIDVGYGTVVDNTIDFSQSYASRGTLADLDRDHLFDFNLIVISGTSSYSVGHLNRLAALTGYRYTEPGKYVPFQDQMFDSTHNREFYQALDDKYGDAGSGARKKKKDEEDNAGKLLKEVQGLFKTLTLTPDGAKYYIASGGDSDTGFGNEGDWSNKKGASDQTKNALSDDLITKAGDLLNKAGNKILLVTYDSCMFSDFTTDPESEPKTMSGVPLSTDVNYFFQSELEYLYNGNEKSARSNIAAVAGLLLLVRFVFNYISTFIIKEIREELWYIGSLAGPFAILVRELARLGYALAESFLDLKELMSRPSRGVPLIKTDIDQWTFSLRGMAESIMTSVVGLVVDRRESEPDALDMFYIDYMRIFLLFKDDNELGDRTADLISWNITNKKNGINADEGTMSGAELFNMSEAHTDFIFTTTVDLRMLFLSMPFAQVGFGGVAVPSSLKTMELRVTDYRGY